MIRPAEIRDAALIAALEAAAADRPWSAASLAETLALPSTRAWIAGESAYLVASVFGEILTLGVHPLARRRGLARALLAAAERAWAEAGTREAFLEVRADNTAAVALYLGAGWEQIGARPRYYADGADAALLRRVVEVGC